MPQGPSDAVRAYELPQKAPGERTNQPLTSNLPISITPGFGSSGAGQLPPILTGQAHFDETITSYCAQAKNEKTAAVGGGGDGFPATGRSAHVKRVFALEGGGEARAQAKGGDQSAIISDCWIDVLRVDHLPVAHWGDNYGTNNQQIDFVVHWNDDPDNPEENTDDSNADIQYENANAARETHQLEIKNPQVSQNDVQDGDDNQLWLIDRTGLQIFQSDGVSGKHGQGIIFTFHNDQPQGQGGENDDGRPADRNVQVVKVVNNDLGGFEMANEDGSHPKIVPFEDYLKRLKAGTNDDSQYLDVEITTRYHHRFQTDEVRGGVQGQEIVMSMIEGKTLAEGYFDYGDPEARDVDGLPCLVRTDPFQTIVNVGFPIGAVFVIGDYGGSSGRIEAKSKNNIKPPLSLGKLAFTDQGQIYGGSFANVTKVDDKGNKTTKPVFLMCGTDNRAPGNIDQVHAGTAKFGKGIIVASKDGRTWDTVLEIEVPVVPGLFGTYVNWVQVLGLTWDGQNFYAGVHALVIFRLISIEPDFIDTSYVIDEHDILWSSSDGYTWQGIDQRTARITKGEHLPKQGLLVDHCSDKVKDKFDNNVPDGIYHYSKDSRGNEIFIRGDAVPSIQWDTGGIDVNVTATTVTIVQTIVSADGKSKNKTKTTCSPGIPFLCLAYAGTTTRGTIIVAGAEIAISTDMGKTWTKNAKHVAKNQVVIDGPLAYSDLTPPATTALAARLKDLPKTPK
jgi:hypothetical protein